MLARVCVSVGCACLYMWYVCGRSMRVFVITLATYSIGGPQKNSTTTTSFGC